MKGYIEDIEAVAIGNDHFRRVLYTARHCQLVVMALKPGEDIGAEVHQVDQFFRVEAGSGEAVIDGVRTAIRSGSAVVVPAGARHDIVNTGEVPLKLYTIYAPPTIGTAWCIARGRMPRRTPSTSKARPPNERRVRRRPGRRPRRR